VRGRCKRCASFDIQPSVFIDEIAVLVSMATSSSVATHLRWVCEHVANGEREYEKDAGWCCSCYAWWYVNHDSPEKVLILILKKFAEIVIHFI
jgi:hypothetical protein